MTLPHVTDHPRWTHRLAVALRFVDHFSGAVIGAPLEVWTELPPLPPPPGDGRWRARRGASDDT